MISKEERAIKQLFGKTGEKIYGATCRHGLRGSYNDWRRDSTRILTVTLQT